MRNIQFATHFPMKTSAIQTSFRLFLIIQIKNNMYVIIIQITPELYRLKYYAEKESVYYNII